jgi:hypothetical protein
VLALYYRTIFIVEQSFISDTNTAREREVLSFMSGTQSCYSVIELLFKYNALCVAQKFIVY